jgi:hypothetical protein
MQENIYRKRPEFNHRRYVALSVDAQDDGEVTLLVAGASESMLRRTMDFLCGGGHGIAENYEIEHQHALRYRNGYVYDRLAVQLNGYRHQYASIGDLLILVGARLRQELHGGSVDFYDIDDFLNLQGRDAKRMLSPADAGSPTKRAERERTVNQTSWSTQKRLGIAPNDGGKE